MRHWKTLGALLVAAATVAGCAAEQPPPPPRPLVAGLDCTQAIWSGSPYPSPPHSVTVLAGSPGAVAVYGTPGTTPWGLQCMNGYVRTGCHMGADTRFGPYAYPGVYPTPYVGAPPPAADSDNWDLRVDGTQDGNGCYTTRPDLVTRAYIAISCCRVASR
ncbi:MAG: hypothetical protein IT561_14780 [Alphaproteobacteria bacterium]|nr:hypothetical protein [Alphaproteobacteria bacterium]